MTRERSLPLIANPVARRLLLSGAGMLERPKGRCTTRTVKDIIYALGYVQLDSIYRVERAHHSILFSRTSSYKQTYLKHLLERERSVFENWTHDAAIIPVEFFPYWQRHFVRFAPYLWKRWHAANRLQDRVDLDRIKTHIANHGPVLARDLAPETNAKRNGWWDWHPSKAALEFLWRTGELAVTRRDGFQKVYDLTENVIPAAFRTGPVASEQFVDW
ncbi:MAG: crosslink repair DNA glycosylase YcaQ family protein, partial [Pseudomonadota bacterium]